jgi:hypothetical protein
MSFESLAGQAHQWIEQAFQQWVARHLKLHDIADVVIILSLGFYLLREFIGPSWRRLRLRHPVKARFNIASREQFQDLNYVIQDDKEHNTKLLVLPTHTHNLLIHTVWTQRLDYTQSELEFWFEDIKDEDNRKTVPLIHYWFHPFIKVGDSKRKPGEYPGHYIDYHDNYHIEAIRSRAKGQAVTSAFMISTRDPGTYRFKMRVVADGIEGTTWLPVRVEETPTSAIRCTIHRHCFVRSRPVIKY